MDGAKYSRASSTCVVVRRGKKVSGKMKQLAASSAYPSAFCDALVHVHAALTAD